MSLSELAVGDKVLVNGDEARVMCVAEGWIMARKKGAMPFCIAVSDVILSDSGWKHVPRYGRKK